MNVYDRGEHDGTYYIAMEYLPGPTLKDVIVEQGALDQAAAIDIACSSCARPASRTAAASSTAT